MLQNTSKLEKFQGLPEMISTSKLLYFSIFEVI